MSTTQELITETLSYLLAGTREQMVRLNGDHDDTTTTFTFVDAFTFTAPAVLSVGLEDVMVWGVDSANRTAEVERGWADSAAGEHSDRTAVRVNAKFAPSSILRALNSELMALSSPKNGLFRMLTTELTFNPVVRGYDLDVIVNVDQIYDVRYNSVGPERDWPQIRRWQLIRDASTETFPSGSGFALVFDGAEPGRTVRVTYKAPFGQLVFLDDDVQATAGLPATANDIPPLGAAFRLASVRELARNFFEHQGETRRAEEVPPGSQLRGAGGFFQLLQMRISEEAARLSRAYPVRKHQ